MFFYTRSRNIFNNKKSFNSGMTIVGETEREKIFFSLFLKKEKKKKKSENIQKDGVKAKAQGVRC